MAGTGEGNGTRKKNNNGASRRFYYKSHRLIGVVSALFFVVLAVTGPLLLHGKDLNLHEKWVSNDFVLSFYDTDPANPPRGVETEAGWVLAVDGVFLLNQRLLGRDQGVLIGATVDGDYLVIASDHGLSLLTRDGDAIEHLGPDALPGPVLRIGAASQRVVIETPQGLYRSDDDYLSWNSADGGDVLWVEVNDNPPAEESAWALEAYRRHLVTMHRLMTDIHSGRIVGGWGPYMMDAAAIAMLLMVASGLINWWSNLRRFRR